MILALKDLFLTTRETVGWDSALFDPATYFSEYQGLTSGAVLLIASSESVLQTVYLDRSVSDTVILVQDPKRKTLPAAHLQQRRPRARKMILEPHISDPSLIGFEYSAGTVMKGVPIL